MTVRNIRHIGDPVLSRTADPVVDFDSEQILRTIRQAGWYDGLDAAKIKLSPH